MKRHLVYQTVKPKNRDDIIAMLKERNKLSIQKGDKLLILASYADYYLRITKDQSMIDSTVTAQCDPYYSRSGREWLVSVIDNEGVSAHIPVKFLMKVEES